MPIRPLYSFQSVESAIATCRHCICRAAHAKTAPRFPGMPFHGAHHVGDGLDHASRGLGHPTLVQGTARTGASVTLCQVPSPALYL